MAIVRKGSQDTNNSNHEKKLNFIALRLKTPIHEM